MTMANTTMSSPSARSGVSLRKTNKPLMEKRRRARINDSLTQLKSLVIQGTKKDSSQFNKLEKADILELTVKHLRSLQTQQQNQLSMAQASNNDPTLAGKYQAGFMECANEVIHFLSQSQSFSDDIKSRVVGHLASCIQLAARKPNYSKTIPAAVTANSVAPSVNVMNAGQAPSSSAMASAQLANGQIIQIINSPFQHVKCTSSTVHIAPSPSSVPVSSPPQSTAAPTPSAISSSSAVSSEPSPPYIRYTQPLHIQIPPVLSPVLVQSQTSQQQQQQQQQQLQQRQQPIHPQPTLQRVQEVAAPAANRIPNPSHQERVVSSTSPASQHKEKSVSPHPIHAAQKHHSFYTQYDENSDFIPRSRTYSMTSSSSSESELTSPLNLSQSPQYYESSKDAMHHQRQTSNKYSSLQDHHHHHHHSHHAPSSYYTDEKNSPSRQILGDHYSPSSNLTSVIVDGRKMVDVVPMSSLKYMNMMMEDDRSCAHTEGSTSPASSVGEAGVWRPW